MNLKKKNFDEYVKTSGLFKVSDKDLIIPIGKKLTSKPFERLILQYYNLTLSEENRIFFSMEHIEWCALPELLIFLLWLNQLKLLNKDIIISLPYCSRFYYEEESARSKMQIWERRAAACSFLFRFGFFSWIKHRGIKIHNENQTFLRISDTEDPFSAKILQITEFSNLNDPLSRISQIKRDSTLRNLLEKYGCIEAFDSRILEDILVKEIVNNVIEWSTHGQARKPMGLIATRLVKKPYWYRDEIGPWEIELMDLGAGPYIEIAIANLGRTIIDTLSKSYEKDESKKAYYPAKVDDNPENHQYLLQYAYEKWSSGRNIKSRFLLDEIPRGLWWVKDIVSQYGGYIGTRSGSGRIGECFLNSKSGQIYPQKKQSVQDMPLSLVHVILPKYDKKRFWSFYIKRGKERESRRKSFLFPLTTKVLENAEFKSEIESIIFNLEKFIRTKGKSVIFFDILEDFNIWNKDSLYKLFRVLSMLQDHETSVCIISGVNRKNWDLINEVIELFNSDDTLRNELDKIVPLLSTDGQLLFAGIEQMQKELIQYMLQAKDIDRFSIKKICEKYHKDEENTYDFYRKNNHIFYSDSEEKISLEFNIRDSADLYYIAWKIFLIKKMQNPFPNENDKPLIHFGDAYYLPSGKYSLKYFELGPLLRYDRWSKRIAKALSTKINIELSNKKFGSIIGGTACVQPLIDSMSEEFNISDRNTLCIETYLESEYHSDIELVDTGNNLVLILTDVVSSGNLVKNISEAVLSIHNKYVGAIATIIDIRENPTDTINIQGYDVPIFSLYQEKIKKFESKALIEQKQYNDIINIDKVWASPVYEDADIHNQFLIQQSELLSNFAQEGFGIVYRHVNSGGNHSTFYLNTTEIFSNHSEEIIDIIYNNFINQLEDIKEINLWKNETIPIVYPWKSGARFLIEGLKRRLSNDANLL